MFNVHENLFALVMFICLLLLLCSLSTCYSDYRKSLDKLQITSTFLILVRINVIVHYILLHMVKRFQLNSAFIDHLLCT